MLFSVRQLSSRARLRSELATSADERWEVAGSRGAPK